MALSQSLEKPVSEDIALANVLLARQPIYNRNMGVYAYELLFRSAHQTINDISKDNATTQVFINAFLTIGLDNLVGTRLASVNISEWYLYKADKLPVPAEQMILEIPSSLKVAPDTISIIKKLKSMGFTLALDQYAHKKELQKLFPYVDLVKVDVQRISKQELPKFVRQFRHYRHLSLLVLKVESLQEYRDYCDLGFDYCQGNLLSKPRVYQTSELSSSKVYLMNLLSVLYKPNADFSEVERIISRDVSVSYKLLNLINSAFFGLPRPVESIQEAVVLLGQDKLKGWISMLALNSLDDCPASLMELAVVRAKMCELLARCAGMPWLDSYFTVGLFSVLDVLMRQPLQRVIGKLPLSDDVKNAILQQEGEMGEALKCVLAYENSDWSSVNFQGLEQRQISKAGSQAFVWATGLMRTI
jgi:EAL and modified HD-GYP domain-containing signal transduction protein